MVAAAQLAEGRRNSGKPVPATDQEAERGRSCQLREAPAGNAPVRDNRRSPIPALARFHHLGSRIARMIASAPASFRRASCGTNLELAPIGGASANPVLPCLYCLPAVDRRHSKNC